MSLVKRNNGDLVGGRDKRGARCMLASLLVISPLQNRKCDTKRARRRVLFFFRDTNEIKGSFVASFTKYAYLHFAIRREEDRYRGKGEERAELLFRLPRFLKLSFPSS